MYQTQVCFIGSGLGPLARHEMSVDRGHIVLIVLLLIAVGHAVRSRLPSLPRFGAHTLDYQYTEAPNLRFRHAKEEQEEFCRESSNRAKAPVHAELQSIQFEDVTFDMLIYPDDSHVYVSGWIRKHGGWEKGPSCC